MRSLTLALILCCFTGCFTGAARAQSLGYSIAAGSIIQVLQAPTATSQSQNSPNVSPKVYIEIANDGIQGTNSVIWCSWYTSTPTAVGQYSFPLGPWNQTTTNYQQKRIWGPAQTYGAYGTTGFIPQVPQLLLYCMALSGGGPGILNVMTW
jgi:hypothetical protein